MENREASAPFLWWILCWHPRVWQAGRRSPFIIPTRGREFFLTQKCRRRKGNRDILLLSLVQIVIIDASLVVIYRFCTMLSVNHPAIGVPSSYYISMYGIFTHKVFFRWSSPPFCVLWMYVIPMTPKTQAWGLAQRHALRAAAAPGAPGTLRGGDPSARCGHHAQWKVYGKYVGKCIREHVAQLFM